jgi:hypothetical protein
MSKFSGSIIAKLAAAAAVSALALGCSGPIMIGQMNPKPNFDLPSTQKTISLSFGPKVQDEFETRQDGIGVIKFSNWKNSLQQGFKNGFEDYLTIAESGESDYVLKILQTEPEFVTAARTADNYIVSAVMQITYKAELYYLDNKIASSAHTVRAKSSTANRDKAFENAKSAIESMYEVIADDVGRAMVFFYKHQKGEEIGEVPQASPGEI